jgi:hypothetical protein
MKRITGLVPAFALFGLAACHAPFEPMVGGPCTYDTSIVEGTVVYVEESGARLKGENEEVFWVPLEYLGTLPEVGDTLTLQRQLITEGTCTPEIYTVLSETDG